MYYVLCIYNQYNVLLLFLILSYDPVIVFGICKGKYHFLRSNVFAAMRWITSKVKVKSCAEWLLWVIVKYD